MNIHTTYIYIYICIYIYTTYILHTYIHINIVKYTANMYKYICIYTKYVFIICQNLFLF